MLYLNVFKRSHKMNPNTKTNSRNKHGVKDSSTCYLTISGKQWNQMTDFRLKRDTNEMGDLTKENVKDEILDLEKEYPEMVFKYRKVSGLYRIYCRIKTNKEVLLS